MEWSSTALAAVSYTHLDVYKRQGTSTVTTFVESSTGIEDGGRTGLTSMTTGILFLLAIVPDPVPGIVPSAATAPALMILGVFMMKGLLKSDWFQWVITAIITRLPRMARDVYKRQASWRW